MAIYLITGRPGEGKGYVAAALAAERLARGRRVYADYFLEGARPWLAWEDAGTPAFRGSCFFGDEVGATFGARTTMALDPIVFAAATLHRHVQTDIYLTAQHLSFIDVQFRRLCAGVIVVRRTGPGGERALAAGRGRRRFPLSLLDHPWWFTAACFGLEAFDADGELKQPFAGPDPDAVGYGRRDQADAAMWRRTFLYKSKIARSYDTTQTIIPPVLLERWQALCANAHERAGLPAMRAAIALEGGEYEQLVGDMRLPERLSAREAAKGEKEVSAMHVVMARGFYSAGSVYAAPPAVSARDSGGVGTAAEVAV